MDPALKVVLEQLKELKKDIKGIFSRSSVMAHVLIVM
jgi:hypothetical protein